MVRGNAARRKELAERRRSDKANEKIRRAAGPQHATANEARARLLSDAKITTFKQGHPLGPERLNMQQSEHACHDNDDGDLAHLSEQRDPANFRVRTSRTLNKQTGATTPSPVAWVLSSTDGGRDTVTATKQWWCAMYFRTGTCPAKRCKYGHTTTIMDTSDNSTSAFGLSLLPSPSPLPEDEQQCSQPLPPMIQKPLAAAADAGGGLVYDPKVRTKVRRESTLLFITWDNVLVYDFCDGRVFAAYAAAATNARSRRPSQETHPHKDAELSSDGNQ